MKPDPFEQHLTRQPLRPVPPEWRESVLRRAVAAPDPARPRPGLLGGLGGLVREWLWPHPVAWAGLAACWLAVLALNHAARPAAAELAEARVGARIGEMVTAAVGSPLATALTRDAADLPAGRRPGGGRADRGRHHPAATLFLA